MKTKNEILEELYVTEYVDKYTRQICVNKEYVDDFIQEVWMIICQLPEERLQDLYEERGIDKIRQFVGGIINRTARSTKSQAFYKLVQKDVRNVERKINNDKKLKYNEEEGWDGIDI